MLSYSCFCYMFFFLFFGAMKSFIKVHFLIFYNNSAWIHWGLLLLFTAVNFRHLPEFELVGIPLSVNQNRPKPSPLAGSFFFVWLGKRICVSLSVKTLNFPLSYPTAPQIPLFFSLQLFLDCSSSTPKACSGIMIRRLFPGIRSFLFSVFKFTVKVLSLFFF